MNARRLTLALTSATLLSLLLLSGDPLLVLAVGLSAWALGASMMDSQR